MTTELDRFPVAQLPNRYKLKGRSNVYERLSYLDIKPEKVGRFAYINADQLEAMDQLHLHIQTGQPMNGFGTSDRSSDSMDDTSDLSYRPVGHEHLSYKTQDTPASYHLPSVTPLPLLSDERLFQFLELMAQHLTARSNPLANLEAIEQAYEHGWLLSTSQLAPLLGVKSITGKTVSRFGFQFERVGRNGTESAWQISKKEPQRPTAEV